ncbi:MAG: DNA repair protein RadA [Crocinitomix sp. MedPE-SWsnd]|nr:MAG: DNA repair protein RadA [Crocinitomix sp. MedPE-SWsnd]
MAKIKTSFFCQNCGAQSDKWVGKCGSCNEWNTYVEEVIDKSPKSATPFSSSTTQRAAKAHKLDEIEQKIEKRIELKDAELNRVLGGGMVPGSLILFGGEPGIGKSTLLLQMAIKESDKKILYISGEESETQIKMRADRIGKDNENCFVLTETSMQNVFIQIEAVQPDILIIDSVQTMQSAIIESSPGSISQIRECTAELLRFAKESGTPVFLIGHITKEGSLAGPKVLEHMVDTVLVFEGDRNHVYRIVRSVKNRFGSTNEIGIYEMHGAGLRGVENPSEILITNNEEELSGIAIASTLEGVRPILVEVQALVSTAAYGTPQRSSTGFDLRRLNMLLAVLEKRCGFKLGTKDVFLNIAGGIKVQDPAIDLGVVCAIMSSNANIPISNKICLSAELSLSGEIRPVNRIEQRISEAQKMGFDQIIISKHNKGVKQANFDIEIIQIGKIEEAIKAIFG